MNIDEKYIIYYNGVPYHKINQTLLQKQNAEENLEAIKGLHVARIALYETMNHINDKKELRELATHAMKIERMLQSLWKFEINDNTIKFWNFPKCKCPSMDNEDRYSLGIGYIYAQNCPLHGWD